MTSIRLLIADDHPLVLRGLQSIFAGRRDIVVAGVAGGGTEAVRLFREIRPDVVALDLRMPDMGGLQALGEIRAIDPRARVVILTTFDDEEDVWRALHEGARAYVLKTAPPEEIVAAILRVSEGQRYVPMALSGKLLERLEGSRLTPREIDVLTLAARGEKNKQIAAQLHITEGTVKSYINNILLKLGARDRTEAVTIGLRRGMIRIEKI